MLQRLIKFLFSGVGIRFHYFLVNFLSKISHGELVSLCVQRCWPLPEILPSSAASNFSTSSRSMVKNTFYFRIQINLIPLKSPKSHICERNSLRKVLVQYDMVRNFFTIRYSSTVWYNLFITNVNNTTYIPQLKLRIHIKWFSVHIKAHC